MGEFIYTIFNPDPELANVSPRTTLSNGILELCSWIEGRHSIDVPPYPTGPVTVSKLHELAKVARIVRLRCKGCESLPLCVCDVHALKFIDGVQWYHTMDCACISNLLFPVGDNEFEQNPVEKVRNILKGIQHRNCSTMNG